MSREQYASSKKVGHGTGDGYQLSYISAFDPSADKKRNLASKIVRSGAQWRELPEAYGPWQSVYARFAKWRDDGTLERVFHTLSGDEDMENLSMDSTCIKVHESANGGGKNGR